MVKTELQLKRIADSLEKLIDILTTSQNDNVYPTNIECDKSQSKEEELFQLAANVYLQEAKLIKEKGLSRKSAVRVSNNLTSTFIDFFSSHLSDFEVVSGTCGLLIFKKFGVAKAALRIYTDLGFGHRGERWIDAKNGIKEVIKEAHRYGLDQEYVYFLVLSWKNGIDNQHVKKLLGVDISNKEMLSPHNKDLLHQYTYHYISMLQKYLSIAHKQVFFLAREIHPNVYAQHVFEGKKVEDLKKYNWISPSVTEMMEYIRTIN
ncbi:hypothetical protein [Priestia aryabhattai]|uniref:hypothetical protein n=1 Tax=Priestia aryabhattai TaxID=412384 RepID=UPI0015F4B07D|nr:hypothetical protein [Priestia aryabhattai]